MSNVKVVIMAAYHPLPTFWVVQRWISCLVSTLKLILNGLS